MTAPRDELSELFADLNHVAEDLRTSPATSPAKTPKVGAEPELRMPGGPGALAFAGSLGPRSSGLAGRGNASPLRVTSQFEGIFEDMMRDLDAAAASALPPPTPPQKQPQQKPIEDAVRAMDDLNRQLDTLGTPPNSKTAEAPKPAEPTPIAATQQSKHTEQTPTAATEAPKHAESTPTATTQQFKPAEQTPTAASEAPKPAEPTPTATTQQFKPAEQTPTAATEAPKLAEPTPTATTQQSKPVESTPTAATEAPKPAEPTPKAATQQTKPAEQTPEATSEASKPAEQTPTATTQQSKPAEQTSEAASEAPKLAGSTPTAVSEAPKLAGSTPTAVSEAPKPAEQTSEAASEAPKPAGSTPITVSEAPKYAEQTPSAASESLKPAEMTAMQSPPPKPRRTYLEAKPATSPVITVESPSTPAKTPQQEQPLPLSPVMTTLTVREAAGAEAGATVTIAIPQVFTVESPSTPAKTPQREQTLPLSPAVTTLTIREAAGAEAEATVELPTVVTPTRVYVHPPPILHNKSRSLSVRVCRQSLVPPVPGRIAPLAPHQRQMPPSCPPPAPPVDRSKTTSPRVAPESSPSLTPATDPLAEPTVAEMQGIVSQDVIDALQGLPARHRNTVAVGEENDGGQQTDSVQFAVFNDGAQQSGGRSHQKAGNVLAVTPRGRQPSRHKELVPWMRDMCIDRETGHALLAGGVSLRELTSLSDGDLLMLGLRPLSKRLQLFFNIWICTPWLYRPGDPDPASALPASSTIPKSTSMPDIHCLVPPSPRPADSMTLSPKASPPEGVLLPEASEPDSPLVQETVTLQHLLTSVKCYRWFHEINGERRKRTIQLAEVLRQAAARIATFRQLLLDDTGRHGGHAMKESDAKVLRFFFDLQSVWETLAKAIGSAIARWTKASCLGDALLSDANVEHWCASFMQYFASRGLSMSVLEPLTTAKKLAARFRSIEEQTGQSVLATFYSQTTTMLQEFRSGVESVRAATHLDHPDFRKLCTVQSRLVALQSADDRIRTADRQKMDDLRTLERVTLTVMSGPRHLVTYGRTFILEGELAELRPDLAAKRKTYRLQWHFMLFSDMLLLGKKDGKRLKVKHAYALHTPGAAVIDIEDGQSVGGVITATNAWALQLTTAVFFEASSPADKIGIVEVFTRTLRSLLESVQRAREENATIQAQLAM